MLVRRSLTVALILFVAALLFNPIIAEEDKKEAEYDYIGAKKCRICHKKDGIYEAWEKTPHATAWDSLSAEKKEKEEYEKYYTTGIDDDGDLLVNVQCEACHGPGSAYKKKSIMEDRELAIKNGLIIPTEETCKKCHNENATPELAATAKGFDMEKMMKAGVHNMPYSSEKEAEKK